MKILKVTKSQGFSLSLEDAFFEKCITKVHNHDPTIFPNIFLSQKKMQHNFFSFTFKCLFVYFSINTVQDSKRSKDREIEAKNSEEKKKSSSKEEIDRYIM